MSGVLSLTISTPVQAQSSSNAGADARTSTAAYTSPATATAAHIHSNARQDGAQQASARTERKRKPHWFDERLQEEAAPATAGSTFERLSYTRYEGERSAGSGSCVYYQNTYTYSCR